MRELSSEDIIAHRFTTCRKGYDTLEVDRYLERVAEYVGWMQQELARHQATERSAIDVLMHARRVADETVAEAERTAAQIEQKAKLGFDNARKDARRTLDEARADADRTVLAARVEAEATIEHTHLRIAALEDAAAQRSRELDDFLERFRISVTESASDLRSAGSRLLEMADQFQNEVTSRTEPVGPGRLLSLSERGVDVS